ncbi:MAG: ABC transporter permease [Chthoniobacterales bacterium]|nr:ABC transporter permease [Chthoniobacterales bacterium]
MNHLRVALRQLLKSPGFTIVAILTLALGIGANTAIFSVINAVLLRPLPYPDPDRVVILQESDADQPNISVSFPDYVDWKKDNHVFEQLAVARRESYNLSGVKGRAPEQVSGAIVTANFFKVVGLAPQLGRVFTEEEDRAGGPALAVISDPLWQRVFQRDPRVLGRAVNFGGQFYTVIGVMGPRMFSPRTVEVWFPLMHRATGTSWTMRDNHPGLFGWGRLKKGVSLEDANAEMKAIAARLTQLYPESNSKIGVNLTRLLENQVGEYRASLTLILAAVAVVLLIACANLANLLAARGAARSREFAIRVALGATRWQIVRQLLTESLVLALLGGLLGFAFAAWGRDLLVALCPPDSKRFQETNLDGWVMMFTGLLAIATSVLFGLWPAWTASRADAQLALKSGAHGSSDAPGARRSRELLIVAEVALALVLLSTAALVLQSFAKTMALSLGFEPQQLLTARVDLPSPAYEDEKKLVVFSNALLGKLHQLPGLEKVALAANPPFMTGWQDGFLPEGAPEPPPGRQPSAEMAVVSPDYFPTIQTPLLRGRSFQPNETKSAPPILIVDQLMADRYFPGQDPIGKRIRIQTDDSGRKMRTIVGVVPHLKVYGFDEQTSLPQIYLPMLQQPQTGLVILLRTSLPPDSLEKSLRDIVASLDPAQPVFEVRSMQSRVAETWATPRLMTTLLTAFSGLALILAVIGLYGVMAYNGLRRTREIGVRLALGARRGQIAAMMLRQGLRLFVIGLGIGFAGAIVLSRVMRSLLFQVDVSNPVIYLAVSLVLAGAALIACWIPARRAARINPMVTLRAE